jgi:hypothetical protein
MGHQTSRRLLREGHMLPREPIAAIFALIFSWRIIVRTKKNTVCIAAVQISEAHQPENFLLIAPLVIFEICSVEGSSC